MLKHIKVIGGSSWQLSGRKEDTNGVHVCTGFDIQRASILGRQDQKAFVETILKCRAKDGADQPILSTLEPTCFQSRTHSLQNC